MKYTKEQLIDFAKFTAEVSVTRENVESLFIIWEFNESVKDQEFQDREENGFGAEDNDLEDDDYLRYNGYNDNN